MPSFSISLAAATQATSKDDMPDLNSLLAIARRDPEDLVSDAISDAVENIMASKYQNSPLHDGLLYSTQHLIEVKVYDRQL